jgi:hypothetical protein
MANKKSEKRAEGTQFETEKYSAVLRINTSHHAFLNRVDISIDLTKKLQH